MKKWRWLVVGLVLIFWLLCQPMALGQSFNPGQVNILVIDKLSIEDLDPSSTPTLYHLAETGSIGLSSNRSLGKETSEDSYLTIGAGNLAHASENGILGSNSNEPVALRNQSGAQLYKNLTGISPGKNEILLVNLPEIMNGMAEDQVKTRLGMMGQIFRENHIRVCVLGNADINGMPYRPAVGMAMDENGRVPFGDVGPITSQAVTDSYVTTRSNYSNLLAKYDQYKNKAAVRIIDLPDLSRAEKADIVSQDIQIKERQRILHDIDQFVKQVADKMDFSKDLLIIAVPSASQQNIEMKETSTPLIIIGPGYKNGFLSSSTTRRDYIVASTDIAPTVLKYFNIQEKPIEMIGQDIKSYQDGKSDHLQTAKQISARAALVNQVRAPLVKGFVLLQIIIICLALFCIFVNRKINSLVSPLLLAMVVVPLIFIFIPMMPFANGWQYILIAIISTILVTLITTKIFKGNIIRGLLIISALTIVILNYDVLTGSHLIQSSVLGYDFMSGARYYGIGNEYVGVLVGSSVLVGAALFQRFKKRWILGLIALFFISQAYLLAAPGLGAQSDGMITAPAAFLVTLILLSGYRINPKVIMSIAGVVLISVSALTLYDMNRPPELQSHIGRAANQIYQGGWKEALLIISRKMGMNIKLMRYTIWSRVFLIILATLIILVYRPVGVMGLIKNKYSELFKGFAGILVGAIVGGVINDSGIVSAATTSIYLITPLLILILENTKVLAGKRLMNRYQI